MMGYRVGLRFDALVGIKSVNKMMRDFGAFSNREGVGTSQTITFTANFVKVPTDKKILQDIGDTLMKTFNESKTNDLEMLRCNFDGYENIEEVELEFEEVTKTETSEIEENK